MSLSARRAWIEIVKRISGVRHGMTSLSARRAWIEILSRDSDGAYIVVALRKESVDRNHAVQIVIVVVHVALRKESVDRNCRYPACCVGLLVALRKESVDRNLWWGVRKAVGSRRSPQGERG